MPAAPVPPLVPIEGVVLDFHHTIVDQGEPEVWLELAWRLVSRPGHPAQSLEPNELEGIYAALDIVWELAREVDPTAQRDLDPAVHRRVFHEVVGPIPGVDSELADALYGTLPDVWVPYEDTLPVLCALHEHGLPIALLSNVGFDVRPILARTGIDQLIAGLALSYELGVVKPDSTIFEHALGLIDTPPERALMVGDSFSDDGAAGALGVRTLILPRTRGPIHGLEAVLRLVGISL